MAENRDISRGIIRRYALALTAIALIAVITQGYLQAYLYNLSFDAREINLAGKMRMLSQRTAKLALITQSETDAPIQRERLRATIDEFRLIFDGLEAGSTELAVQAAPTEEIRTLFNEARPTLEASLGAADCLLGVGDGCRDDAEELVSIVGQNEDLLRLIAKIPAAYDDLSTGGVQNLRVIEMMLLGLTLLVLVLEVRFIFRPIVRIVSDAMDSVRDQTSEEQRLRRLASMGEMSGGIAHEINSPLAAISFAIQRLQRKLKRGRPISDEDLAEQLGHMADDSQRIQEIVQSVRSLAAGKLPEAKQAIPLETLFDHVTAEFMERQRSGGIDLRVGDVAAGDSVPCVEYQLQQVLVNLMRNAADAVREQDTPWVELSAQVERDNVVLAVRDSGQGIPAETVEKIFDPFFSTKGIGGGMGLGLSLCRKLTELHGGELSYALQDGHTTFLVTLPRDDESGANRFADPNAETSSSV